MNISQAWENYRRDIGGEFVGDHRAFTYFVPIAWMLSMVGYPPAETPAIFAARMLANALAFASCYALLYLFRVTVFRDRYRRTINIFIVIAAGLALGASKVGITGIVLAGLTGDWSGIDSLAIRIAGGAITGAWYLPLSAIILAIQDRYRTARDVVFAARLQNATDATNPGATDPARLKLAGILQQLRKTIQQQQSEPEVLAKSLTKILEKRIRPFSRNLWSKSGRKQNDLSPVELARIVLARRKYWPSLTTVAIVVASAPLIVSTVGWLEGLGRLMILASVAWVTTALLGNSKRSGAGVGLLLYVFGAFAYSIVNEEIVTAVFGPFGDFTALTDIFLNAGLFAALSMLLGILRLTRDELRKLELEMDSIFGERYFVGRMDLERVRMKQRELANIIHGRLQNQILGAVLALTKNPDTTSPDDLLLEIERLEHEVSQSEQSGPLVTPAMLSEELAELATRWQGVIEVKVSRSLPTDMPAEDIAATLILAEEGVTNAVRHGLASTIEIEIQKVPGKWALTVRDDGVGPRNGTRRLGTLTLDHITGKLWSLSSNKAGPGSILEAFIPNTQDPYQIRQNN